MKLDETDIKIIQILQNNGRITNAELAKQIKISPPPTLERVKKLEKGGVIKKYVALVEPAEIGIESFSFMEVTLSRHGKDAVNKFIRAVQKVDEVMECHHITGDADFLLKIAVENIRAYENLVLNRLTDLPNIQHLKTTMVLSTLKNETSFTVRGKKNER